MSTLEKLDQSDLSLTLRSDRKASLVVKPEKLDHLCWFSIKASKNDTALRTLFCFGFFFLPNRSLQYSDLRQEIQNEAFHNRSLTFTTFPPSCSAALPVLHQGCVKRSDLGEILDLPIRHVDGSMIEGRPNDAQTSLGPEDRSHDYHLGPRGAASNYGPFNEKLVCPPDPIHIVLSRNVRQRYHLGHP